MDRHEVIRVDDVHKRYRLGVMGSGMITDEVARMVARMRGRPDPRIRLDREAQARATGTDFWALRGVSFGVQQGEVVGIIGRNGAGKSTLLKLLSRITVPSSGTISLKGRISSLLEVGTGFHPELTGRENIYLNGTILGMRRAEITRKLDEIIAFSGIEHHIDTPVKRYSSGMTVRLGFAVAAHLEPEILIVDEVLAVGDAEFQRKCTGKMKDVAGHGRTVLFVSHNMVAVRTLCERAIWLQDGRVHMDGPVGEVSGQYANSYDRSRSEVTWEADKAPGSEDVRLLRVAVTSDSASGTIGWENGITLELDVRNIAIADNGMALGLHLVTSDEIVAFISGLRENLPDVHIGLGDHRIRCHIPARLLNKGIYRLTVNLVRHGKLVKQIEDAIAFEVHEGERGGAWFGARPGVFRMPMHWTHENL